MLKLWVLGRAESWMVGQPSRRSFVVYMSNGLEAHLSVLFFIVVAKFEHVGEFTREPNSSLRHMPGCMLTVKHCVEQGNGWIAFG